MKIEVTGASPLELEASVLAVPVFEEDLADVKGLVAELDRRLDGHVAAAAAEEDFQGKTGQSLGLRTLGKLRAARILLVGLGKRDGAEAELPRAGFEPLRTAAGEAARQAQKGGATRLAFASPRLPGQTAHEARAIVEGALLGAYRFDRYKTEDKKKKARKLETLVVVVPQGLERSKEVKESVALARSVAGAVAWARDRVNEPPLHLTPSRLADAARELAKEAGLHAEVLGPREIAGLRMGMFLGVTRGSAEEPRLVKISYVPRGAAARKPPVVFVGKAVTFDSGGLSLEAHRGHGGHEDRHGRRRRRHRGHEGGGGARAALPGPSRWSAPARTCRAAGPTSPPTSSSHATARRWRSPTPTPRGGWSWATCWPGASRRSSRP